MTLGLVYLPGFTAQGVDKSKCYLNLAQDILFGSSHHLWKDRADNGLLNQLQLINEKWLGDSKYLAGDEVSIADLSLYGDTGYIRHLFGIDFKQYSNLNRWYQSMDSQFGNDPARKAYIEHMTTLAGLFKDVFPSKPFSSSTHSVPTSTPSVSFTSPSKPSTAS